MNDMDKLTITHSPEYKEYIAALCHLAGGYVPRIRRKIAEQAFEKFQNETIRSLVLAYGEQYEKLQKDRLTDFEMVANDPELFGHGLEDPCLNRAGSYAETIKFFFDI